MWGDVIIGGKKERIEADVLIDDKPSTVRAWMGHRRIGVSIGVSIAWPWNKELATVSSLHAQSGKPGGRSVIISIDPGAQLVGAAAWTNDRKLWSMMLARGKSALELAQVIHAWTLDIGALIDDVVVVLERPQVYPRSRTKGDPNDLITLALVAGMVAGRLDPVAVVEVKPREWKGQVPKDTMIERIKRTLTAEEHCVVARVQCPPSLKHNVWDAVGLGLWYLKRL